MLSRDIMTRQRMISKIYQIKNKKLRKVGQLLVTYGKKLKAIYNL